MDFCLGNCLFKAVLVTSRLSDTLDSVTLERWKFLNLLGKITSIQLSLNWFFITVRFLYHVFWVVSLKQRFILISSIRFSKLEVCKPKLQLRNFKWIRQGVFTLLIWIRQGVFTLLIRTIYQPLCTFKNWLRETTLICFAISNKFHL